MAQGRYPTRAAPARGILGTEGSPAQAMTRVSFNPRSLLGFVLMLAIIVATRAWSYLLFHSLAELFSIVIAAAYFLIAWHTRKTTELPSLAILGISYAFIALLDLFHTLAYAGMGLFPGYQYPANQLWIAARFLEAVSLASFTFFRDPGRRILVPLIGLYSLYVGAILASIFFFRVFPACFIAGQGQTAFKVGMEYVIILIFALAGVLLLRRRALFTNGTLSSLFASILLTILSELSFTLYLTNYDWLNMTGHLLKIASFYLIYRSIIVMGLERPHELLFVRLKTREAELERSNQTKDTFFSILSHDLKSPLSGIHSVAEGMIEENRDTLGKDVIEMLDEIVRTADLSLNLVEKVLTWARCQSGSIRARPSTVNLYKSLQDQIDILSESAEAKKIRLENSVATGALALADRDMIETVLRNLLQNAIKFTPKGGKVIARIERKGPDWVVFIEDSGIGMTNEELSLLFRVDGHLRGIGTEGERGVGFGLILSLEFCQLMGARLEATSIKNKGSTFLLYVPASAPSESIRQDTHEGP
ncbi:MAG: hypothetical protein E4H20_04800 [Spirochaetales bacterium]|nr:MAG: hypothetical protein E4H20_04800 [Spirochaetales bacterium]